jgi:hypothetical protein
MFVELSMIHATLKDVISIKGWGLAEQFPVEQLFQLEETDWS